MVLLACLQPMPRPAIARPLLFMVSLPEAAGTAPFRKSLDRPVVNTRALMGSERMDRMREMFGKHLLAHQQRHAHEGVQKPAYGGLWGLAWL